MIIFSHLEGVEDAQSVLLFRYHRCLADGFSMMQMLLTESRYVYEDVEMSRESLLKDASDSPMEDTTVICEPHTEMVSDAPLVLVSSEQERAVYPSLLSQESKPQCGLRNSSSGSYWRLVCTKKDAVSPLRSKKVADAPKSRFVKTMRMRVTIDDLVGVSEHELTINDVILGAIFHAVTSFFSPRFAQTGAKPIHVCSGGERDG